jgi:hypothetical protein
MFQAQFIRSNTFRWASAVAGVFAAFVTVLFGFIYFTIDDYLVARSDRMITVQLSYFASLPGERWIPGASSSSACSMRMGSGLPAIFSACPTS